MSASNNQARSRKSRGRQKVSMVKMENRSNLQVTFSKRRAGLFKKASELCTLCGAQAAIVVFSPAEKVYCFGHPNVQTVLDKFSANDGIISTNINNNNNNNNPNPTTNQLIMEVHRNSTIRELNLELTQMEGMLRAEKRRAEELEMIKRTGRVQQWFPGPLEEFNFAQLCVLKESIMGFKKKMDAKVQREMLLVNAAVLQANFTNPHHHAGFNYFSGNIIGSVAQANYSDNPMTSSNNHGGLVNPSSQVPTDPIVGSRSFGGYNIGYEYDPRSLF